MPLDDIPSFLKLSAEERRAAWEKHRLEAKALPLETMAPLKRIKGIPGAKDEHADDNDD
jgi:hypothetical protein